MRLVITSVKYGDMLPLVLPAWKAIVPSVTVATSPEDRESQDVAADHGVPCVVTDAWTRCDEGHIGGPAKFNMGFGINVALGLRGDVVAPPASGEVCAHVSADCYPFGKWPSESDLRTDTIYGFWRYECLTHGALTEHIRGSRTIGRFQRLKNSGSMPIGYFQMFRAQAGRWMPSYPTAGKTDTHFAKSFPRFEMLTSLYFLHLGPINNHANWAGRVVPQWEVA
jgi:hypothetical protein